MSGKLKIGIIGSGKMGTLHLEKYLGIPDIDVMGVYETNPARRELLKAKYSVRAFDQLSDLLFEADGVTIASPTATHYSVARQVFEAGVHALIEKPLCDNLPQAEELVRLSKQHRVILQIGFIERFRYAALAKAFPLAPVRFIEGHRLSATLNREHTIDVVSDLMIHDLDLALSVIGAEPSLISAVGIPVITPHCDLANVRLEFPDGAVASLNASRVSERPFRKFRTFSLRAYASMDLITNIVEVCRPDGKGGLDRRVLKYGVIDALDAQCRHFIQCIRQSRQPLVSGEDGLKALRVAHRIREKIDERAAMLPPLPVAPIDRSLSS